MTSNVSVNLRQVHIRLVCLHFGGTFRTTTNEVVTPFIIPTRARSLGL